MAKGQRRFGGQHRNRRGAQKTGPQPPHKGQRNNICSQCKDHLHRHRRCARCNLFVWCTDRADGPFMVHKDCPGLKV